MNENFIKYKKQAFVIRFVKSLLLGLAIGGLLAGTLLLLTKLEILSMKAMMPWVLGGAAFVVGGVGGYFLLRVSDRKLARHLDADFALQEKVQTMLAFQKEEGTFHDLQREDANEALGELTKNKKRLKWKRLWIYLVCACLGAGMMLAAFLVQPPEAQPEPEIPEEEFAITDIQVVALQELILYVGNSEMENPYKDNVVDALEVMLAELQEATTVSQKDAALKKAVDEINKQTDDSSEAVELMNALWTYEARSAKQFAKALNYYDWSKENEWEDFSEKWTDFRTSFVHSDSLTDEPDEYKMATETGELLTRLTENLAQSITRVGGGVGDTLCEQLKRFAEVQENNQNGTHLYGLAVLGEYAEIIGYTNVQKELDATFTALAPEVFRGLKIHRTNTDTGEYAMTKIKELFGYVLPKFERPNFYEATEDAPGDGEEEGSGGAGIGDGAVYGSDDLVLDPMTNTYVEYGTILDKYYKLMFGKVEDGSYTEQEKEAMEKYFAILYGGFDEEGE